MALNVCPKCKQITLTLGAESEIKCPICETIYEVKDNSSNGDTVQ